MNVEFYKYHGAGNDFILINNYNQKLDNYFNTKIIRELCERHFGIGADGLIILNQDKDFDFKMRYFNADGMEGTMCGNGGRCIVAFANDLGLLKNIKTNFIASDGIHEASVVNKEYINLNMIDVNKVIKTNNHYIINSGSPHYVKFIKNLSNIDVFNLGKKIRFNPNYEPDGINVNFSEIKNDVVSVRTYERGVENETMACGTGSVATAIAAKHEASNGKYNIPVKTLGGMLNISFIKQENEYTNVCLAGPVKFVFKGHYPLL